MARRSNDFHSEVLKLMVEHEKGLGRRLNAEEAEDFDNKWAAEKLNKPRVESTEALEALMQEPPPGGVIRSEANEAIRSRQFRDMEEANPNLVTDRATYGSPVHESSLERKGDLRV